MNSAFREGSPAIHGRPTREGRIRKLVAFLALLILCWAASLPARAENRLALVIGEDTYEQIAPLRKAVADARAVRGLCAGRATASAKAMTSRPSTSRRRSPPSFMRSDTRRMEGCLLRAARTAS